MIHNREYQEYERAMKSSTVPVVYNDSYDRLRVEKFIIIAERFMELGKVDEADSTLKMIPARLAYIPITAPKMYAILEKIKSAKLKLESNKQVIILPDNTPKPNKYLKAIVK